MEAAASRVVHLRGLPWQASAADVEAAIERGIGRGTHKLGAALTHDVCLLVDKDGRQSGTALIAFATAAPPSCPDASGAGVVGAADEDADAASVAVPRDVATAAAAAAAAALSHERVGGRWLDATAIGAAEASELRRRSSENAERAARLAAQAFGQDASERPRPPAGRREFVVVCHETPAALVQRGKMEINNLPEGRVDLLARCVAASLFYSHGVRKEARVWLLLSDARRAVCCDGGQCRGLRPDERCLASALSRCLAGHPLPGWSTREDVELDALLREVGVGATAVAADGAGTAAPSRLLVMHEAGDPIGPTSSALVPAGGDSALSVPTVTVLGDHLGFTQAEEDCLARCGGARLSLGAVPLLTSQCIIIIHWLLDTSACRCTP